MLEDLQIFSRIVKMMLRVNDVDVIYMRGEVCNRGYFMYFSFSNKSIHYHIDLFAVFYLFISLIAPPVICISFEKRAITYIHVYTWMTSQRSARS